MMFPSCHLSKALSVLMAADTLERFRRRVSLSCAPTGTSVIKAKEEDVDPRVRTGRGSRYSPERGEGRA